MNSRVPEAAAGQRHTDMRAANRAVLLDLIRRNASISRAALAVQSGLAKPTISAIIEELLAEGTIFELGIGQTGRSGGRPPVMYSFNARAWYVAGIHVGVDETTVVLADADGSELARDTLTTSRAGADVAFTTAARSAASLAGRLGVPRDRVRALGVCVAGAVDPVSGTCVFSPNLGWRGVDVPAFFRKRFATADIYVHNVTHAVLFAEHLEGAARDVFDVVLLYEDNGVGGAVLIDGRIHQGTSGLAGEVGHSKLTGATQRCGCGGIGCLETEVARGAILRRAAEIQGSGAALARLESLALATNDDLAPLVADIGACLGHAAAWLINAINPNLVLLAGGFVEYGPAFAEAVSDTIKREAFSELPASVEIRVSMLKEEAAIRGSVLLALHGSEARLRGRGLGRSAHAVKAG